MYPLTFFGLFPPFPRDERVFVAMSFAQRFNARWEDVIAPAIKTARLNDRPLEPMRANLRITGDSILTEILESISRCRLFFADITSVGEIDGRPSRNANVFYEVGLAHASRLPEEVLLFRSDNRELLFDIANIRVHRYDPDGSPEAARKVVVDTINDSLREIDHKKRLAVKHAAESLDRHCVNVLLATVADGTGVVHPSSTQTVGQILGGLSRSQAITRLLEVGALRTALTKMTPELLSCDSEITDEEVVSYRLTPMGYAIVEYVTGEMTD